MVRNASVEQLTIPYFSKRIGLAPTQVYEITAELYSPNEITFDICIVDENETHPIDRAVVEPSVPFLTIVAEDSYNRYCNRFFYRNGKIKFAGTTNMDHVNP